MKKNRNPQSENENPKPSGSKPNKRQHPLSSSAGASSDEIRRIVNRSSGKNAHKYGDANGESGGSRRSSNSTRTPKPPVRPKGLSQRFAVFLRNQQRRKARRKASPAIRVVKRILVVLLILAVIAGAGTFVAWKVLLSYVNRPTETSAPTSNGTTATPTTTAPLTNPVPEVKGITNILLLGVDNRVLEDDDTDSLSDLMIVVTVDGDNKVIKMTSFQRDMLVYVPGEAEPVKLTESHFMGGAMTTMQTLNENFRLDLKHYVKLNINEAERMIDIVGGIDLFISEEILWYANEAISMQNVFFPDTEPAEYLTEPGFQRLNGRQAVGYARVRSLDSDYRRMERQREVLQAMFVSFKSANLGSKVNMLTAGGSIITTNMDDTEITRLVLQVAPVMKEEILQKQVPDRNRYKDQFVETSDFNIRVDLNGTIPELHEFIYNKVYDFDRVKEIPGAPNSGIPMPPNLYLIDEIPDPTPTPTPKPTPEPTPVPTPTTVETTAETEPAVTEATKEDD